MSIRIAVVDDEPQLRREIATLIRMESDLELVGECDDAESALAKLPTVGPEVILMDIQLPLMSGVECTRLIKALLPETQVLMLTVFDDYELIFQSLQAGATGYLLKKFIPTKLHVSIRELLEGGSPMSPSIARKVVQAFSNPVMIQDPIQQLSLRERQILEELGRGLRYKEIADVFNLSVRTVCAHVRNIYEKLQVHSRTEAIRKVRAANPN